MQRITENHTTSQSQKDNLQSLAWLRDFAICRNKKSFSRFINRHYNDVNNFSRRIAWSTMESEDIVQDVFMEVMRRAGEYRQIENVKGWLMFIVRKNCSSRLRAKTRRRKREIRSQNINSAFQSDLENRVQCMNDNQKEVLRHVHKLPEKYKAPILMRYYQGLSLQDTARALELKDSTLRCNITRAIAKLRQSVNLQS